MRQKLMQLEEWVFDESFFLLMAKFTLVFGVPFFAVVFGMLFLLSGNSDEERCLASGRGWAIAGSHVESVYNAALKAPIPTTVTDYGCFDVRR